MQGQIKYNLMEGTQTAGLPHIVVFGVGGGGGNAVEFMAQNQIEGVQFVAANTDAQVLSSLQVPHKIQLGEGGLGAGGKPERGREAAEKSIDQIREALKDADLTFITAGMGGGTGTGAAPVVAQVAKEMGSLTVAVVSLPFMYEMRHRQAEAGLQALIEYVDSLIVIPNDKLSELFGSKPNISLEESFARANMVLKNAVQGIAEVITRRGLVNVDFEDVRTVMSQKGYAMMGVGEAEGENRAMMAVEQAINNPLLDHVSIQGAKGLLVNITAGMVAQAEMDIIGRMVYELADEDAEIILGAANDETLGETLKVTVIATGLDQSAARKIGLRKDILFNNGNTAAGNQAQGHENGVTMHPYGQQEQRDVAGTQPVAGYQTQAGLSNAVSTPVGGTAGVVPSATPGVTSPQPGTVGMTPPPVQPTQPAGGAAMPAAGQPLTGEGLVNGQLPPEAGVHNQAGAGLQPGMGETVSPPVGTGQGQPASAAAQPQPVARTVQDITNTFVEEDRKALKEMARAAGEKMPSGIMGDGYLDIPTFMRDQND